MDGVETNPLDEALGRVAARLKAQKNGILGAIKERKVFEENAWADAQIMAATITALQTALAEMWFAYVNKDADFPHDFEECAVEMARHLLGDWEVCMPKYLSKGVSDCDN